MGLVQAESGEEDTDRTMDLTGIQIVWDANIARMAQHYGRLSIDYTSNFYGPRFVVGFEGVSC